MYNLNLTGSASDSDVEPAAQRFVGELRDEHGDDAVRAATLNGRSILDPDNADATSAQTPN